MVSGCYILGTPYGMLPEIVTPETGRLSQRATDLAEAAAHPERFSPDLCRRRVIEGGFTHLAMARKYVAYYEKVLADGCLGDRDEPAPRTAPDFFANKLLDWTE
jgi:hypothetical protein